MINNAMYAYATTGMTTMQRLDVLANDLANVATPGFKTDRSGLMANMGRVSGADLDKFRKLMEAGGPLINVSTSFTQGMVSPTERDLDVAIEGEGFFELEGEDGPLYTRNGTFRRDADGFLTTQDGLRVMGEGGPIQVQEKQVVIRGDGQLDLDGQEADRLKIVTFDDPSILYKQEGTVFARKSDEVEPVPAEDFRIIQGALEMSNVNPIRAMAELIETERTYEAGMRGMQMVNQINEKMTANVGKSK